MAEETEGDTGETVRVGDLLLWRDLEATAAQVLPSEHSQAEAGVRPRLVTQRPRVLAPRRRPAQGDQDSPVLASANLAQGKEF